MGRLSENSVVSIKNKSHAVTAEISVPADGTAQGVIVAQGGSIGGWSLYLRDGKPRYCYNLLGIQRIYVDSSAEVHAGKHQVRMEFDYAGPGLGKGGSATLYFDGVNWVRIDVDQAADDADHRIDPDQLFRATMASSRRRE